MKTRRDWVLEAMAHELAARWTEAATAWATAASLPEEEVAKRGDRRRGDGIPPGTMLRHTEWGKVTAECTYVGEGNVVYDGVSYGTLSEAANAAAAARGRKSKTLNGWQYWGMDRFRTESGFDQAARDSEGEWEEGDEMEKADDEVDVLVDAYLERAGL